MHTRGGVCKRRSSNRSTRVVALVSSPGCLGDACSACVGCDVRGCARQRGAANCGQCAEYPCQKLTDKYAGMIGKYALWAEDAKTALDEVHQSVQ